MNFIKRHIYILLAFILSSTWVFAVWNDIIKDWLISWQNETIMDVDSPTAWDYSVLDKLFVFIKDSISGLLLLIVVWVFLFMWIKLVTARWNSEEFKKIILQFIYVAVWIFIVSVAWAAVKLVAWIDI